MGRRLRVAFVLLMGIGATTVSAPAKAASPVSVGLFPPVQIVPESGAVHGFRLSLLYGNNAEVKGLDLGLVNRVEGDLAGLQLGAVGFVEGNSAGVQYNYFVNYTGRKFEGAQLGVVNYADKVRGLQFGLVNYTDDLKGLQLGLVNIAKNGFLPVFVILNANFD